MRILHCNSSIDPTAGGPVTAVAGLAKAQAKLGEQVTILATVSPEGQSMDLTNELTTHGIRVERVGLVHGPLGRHPALKATVRQAVQQADIVHIHGVWEEVQHQAARAAHAMGKPYVITPHGMLDRWSLAQSRWKKRLYMLWRLRRNLNRAAAIHFTTDMERDAAADVCGTTPVIVEPLGVALDEFETLPHAGTFRKALGIDADRPLIAFLGRIHPGKGLEYLIPAMAKLKNADAMLVVIGPDSDDFKAQVERMIERLGLRERVLFTGMMKGVDRVAPLADADLYCLPSDHENFGISVIEALAAGTPVIISDQVAIHSAIVSAGVGQAVPTDPTAVAAALDDWLADSAKRETAATKARPFVWAHYDWSAIGRRWVENYSRWAK